MVHYDTDVLHSSSATVIAGCMKLSDIHEFDCRSPPTQLDCLVS